MIVKDIFEFILWDNCKNNCLFCWQKQHYCQSAFIDKIQSCDLALNFILSSNFIQGSHVLIVGGEIFDVEDDTLVSKLISFFDILTDLQLDNTIDLLYINTNLLYNANVCLFLFLDIVKKKNLFSRLKFTTSWDYYGRFHGNEKIWQDNISILQLKYQSINIVVNTIITKQLCNYILCDNGILPSELLKCYVNYVPYVNVNTELSPTKNDVFKFLIHVNDVHPHYLTSYINNFDLPLKKRVYKFKNKAFEDCSSDMSSCGHGVNFCKYSNDNTCFICDVKKLDLIVNV